MKCEGRYLLCSMECTYLLEYILKYLRMVFGCFEYVLYKSQVTPEGEFALMVHACMRAA